MWSKEHNSLAVLDILDITWIDKFNISEDPILGWEWEQTLRYVVFSSPLWLMPTFYRKKVKRQFGNK